MKRNGDLGYHTSRKERLAYCLFFLGQNILWGYAGYVETFLTDIGISAAAAAAIAPQGAAARITFFSKSPFLRWRRRPAPAVGRKYSRLMPCAVV